MKIKHINKLQFGGETWLPEIPISDKTKEISKNISTSRALQQQTFEKERAKHYTKASGGITGKLVFDELLPIAWYNFKAIFTNPNKGEL